MRKKLVYVAGPITSSGHVTDNVNKAIKVGDKLWAEGFVPFVPHLSVLWNMVSPHENYEFWLEYDKQILLRCDCVLRLPGDSKGADEEEKFCNENDIPVYHSLDALIQFEGLNTNLPLGRFL